jgi:NAD dependent epimerase/dehydratase
VNEPPANTWVGRKVLVTGAAGFIGSHLTEALTRAGANVRAFVRYNSRNDYGWLESCDPEVAREIEIFRGDLVNPEAVTDAVRDADRVLHLGALIPIPYSYRHPREFVLANTLGTLNVLEASRRTGIERLVHLSTSEVYGTPVRVPIDESHPLNAQSPYAASKVGADQLALSYRFSFDLPVVIARPFNTYGPRQSARAVIPTIVTQALAGNEIRLGSTHTTRDFLFVDDTVRGLMRCGEVTGLEGIVINLGTGTEISIAALGELILRELGIERTITSVDERTRPPRSEVERLLADIARARSLLGWSPAVPLQEGIRQTIEWLAGSLEHYKPSTYNL